MSKENIQPKQPKKNGGARPGAGRKKLPYEVKTIAVHTNELVINNIEKYRGERKRNRYIVEAIEEKLERDRLKIDGEK